MHLPQIGLDDPGIVLDLAGCSLGNSYTVVEHFDPLADLHDEFHVVLDEKHGKVVILPELQDELQQILRLGGVHPGGWLIKKKELRARGQRPGDLEAPLFAVGQGCGHLPRHIFEPHFLEDVHGPLDHHFLLAAVKRQPQSRPEKRGLDPAVVADHDVLDDGKFREEPDVLEGSGDARLGDPVGLLTGDRFALVVDHAFRGRVVTGDHVEEGRLACAVWSDEADDLVLLEGEVKVVDGDEAAELHGEMLHCQE